MIFEILYASVDIQIIHLIISTSNYLLLMRWVLLIFCAELNQLASSKEFKISSYSHSSFFSTASLTFNILLDRKLDSDENRLEDVMCEEGWYFGPVPPSIKRTCFDEFL